MLSHPINAEFENLYRSRKTEQQRRLIIGSFIFIVITIVSAYIGGFFNITYVYAENGSREPVLNIIAGLPRLGEYLEKTLPNISLATLGKDVSEWFWRWEVWLNLLLETILIAYLATLLGLIGGFLLSFPASSNLAPNKVILHITRRSLEFMRTVPELVWALIFVFSFGIGPLAGVLAIALHSMGAVGKLYSEVNENIDMRPLDGIKASGGNWFQMIRYGVVPQVIPNTISYTLLRFEINVRASSIIGYVGAGGLGQEIRVAMTLQEYTDLSALFIIVLATVVAIDYISEKVRHRIIGYTQ